MSQSAAPIRPRLMLILQPTLAPQEAAARIAAGDVAAVVVRRGEADGARLKALAQPLQKADCAVLLEDLTDLALAAGLDGIHSGDAAILSSALKRLKPAGIVGAGGLSSRHEAMEAGESGADYVMFGPLEGGSADFARTCALVEWWSALFEVPCAAVAGSLAEVEALARAGADFIALEENWVGGADGVASVRAADAAIDSALAETAPPAGSEPSA